ncbi:MAG: NAD(P)/FAD-dependent oxidoreductase [Desulfurococcales archaeon]|nr:NAD(P)/FAD-dependent oxidoreductase [Desulfurococcales archaeon]
MPRVAGYDYAIAGMGPAGVAAAYRLGRLGYRVVILEANPRPAVKPCGWGVPDAEWLPAPIPRGSVVARIRRARLLVDGSEAIRIEGWLSGYIVDKPDFLEELAAQAGAEVTYRAPLLPHRGEARIPGRGLVRLDPSRSLAAVGNAYYPGEKIFALEYEVRLPEGCADPEELLIDFDTRLVGYYWLFPAPGGLFQVGLGGYADPQSLRGRLDRWVRRLPCRAEPATRPRGAPIAVGGLRLSSLAGIPVAGESAGFVLPLTGEGIRPSMASGAAAAGALASGGDPLEAQKAIPAARAVAAQRRVLERVRRMEPGERASLLASIPPRVHAEVALGSLRKAVILRELSRRPRLALRLLRLLGFSE